MQHVRRWAPGVLLVAATIVVACGGASLKQANETCNASSECAEGLLCDFNRDPPVCASMSSPAPDAPVAVDADGDGPLVDAGVDAPVDAAVDAPDAM